MRFRGLTLRRHLRVARGLEPAARIAFRDTRVAATLMEESRVRPAIFQSGVG
jgi:hypothetical protein